MSHDMVTSGCCSDDFVFCEEPESHGFAEGIDRPDEFPVLIVP